MNNQRKNIFFVVFAYLSQFIIANIYYGDDLYRAVFGFGLWSRDGRPLADLFYSSTMLFHDKTLPDIYPIPLIISGVMFCIIFSHVLNNCKFINQKYSYIIALVFIANPYLISNLMFRYDGAFMLLSVSTSILPFAFCSYNLKRWVPVSVICLTASLSLYQSSVNLYIGFVAIFAMYKVFNDEKLKDIINFIVFSAISLLIAYIIYSKIILSNLVLNPYFSNFNQTLPLNFEGARLALKNLKDANGFILLILKSGMLYPLGIANAIAAVSVVILCINENRVMPIIAYVIALVVCYFSFVGIVIFGVSPAYFARVFIGVSIFLSFPLFIILRLIGSNVVRGSACVLLALPLMCISAASVNSSKQEYDFNNMVADRITTDVFQSHAKENKKIAVIGDLRLSPRSVINNMAYPVISVTLPPIFKNGYDGGRFTLMNRGIGDIVIVPQDDLNKIKAVMETTRPFSDNNLYELYDINETTVIKFK